MKSKKKAKIIETSLIVVLLVLLFSQYGYALLTVHVEAFNVQLTVNNGASVGFKGGENGVIVSITSGTLNGSLSMTGWTNKGQIIIDSEDTATFTITGFGDSEFKDCVPGIKGSETANRNNKTQITATTVSGNQITITWSYSGEPALPIMFMVGMIGVGSFFGGALYAAKQIKEGDYVEGLRTALIFCSIGFGLIWGWLNL